MRLSKSLVLLSVFFLFTACTQKKNKGKDNGSPQEALTPIATAPKLDHTKDFSTGNASAPIVIEYFADLQCGACKALSPKLEEIMANPTYKDKLLLVFKNFAKDASCSDYTGQYLHEFSCEAAVAARCVGLYQDKFWEYKEKLIAGDLKAFSLAGFKTLALEFGISEADYNACNADKAVMEKVKADYAEGKQRGVTGTPTIFVNKKKAKFPVAKQDIEAEINALLK